MSDTHKTKHDDNPATADVLGHTKADRPFDGDWIAGRRKRNWAILALLALVCMMFYFITIIRIDEGNAERDRKRAAEAAALINAETQGTVGVTSE